MKLILNIDIYLPQHLIQVRPIGKLKKKPKNKKTKQEKLYIRFQNADYHLGWVTIRIYTLVFNLIESILPG